MRNERGIRGRTLRRAFPPFPSLGAHLSPPYWGFRAALWLAARVPRWPAYRLAALGGELYYWANRAHS
ncbi:MAG: hypothetical protein M3121_01470, partial [Chloroflexota bacterium]|nr:hypothetical protein [Chloroflexota bacterium]